MSREDWKKKMELDELRKSGAIEPERDADGNEINPHIPQYMASAPWYLNTGVGLKHQKNYKDKTVAEGVAARKVEAIGAAKSMSRTRNEFGERVKVKKGLGKKDDAPRANGYDGTFEGKRDRWNGYDPNMYLRVMKKHELQAEERRKLREAKVEASLLVEEEGEDKGKSRAEKRADKKAAKKAEKQEESEDSDSSTDSDEGEVDAEKAELLDQDGKLLGQQLDEGRIGMQTRVSVRNLRIREDTAKYLRNLDVKSAYYDPKTRSMRSNPHPDTNPHDLDFAGDNFVRYTGDTREVAAQQLYEFEAYERGQSVHMLGAPTQAEKLHSSFKEKKDSLVSKQHKDLLEHYGGQEHSEKKLPRSLALGQSEAYVEYAEDGTVVKGQERVIVNAKYEEDKLINNHTKIWGSLWYNGKWGFGCCGQFIRNSYCTGEIGRKVFEGQKGNRIGQSPLYETSSQMVSKMEQQVRSMPKEKEKDGGARKIGMGERLEGKDAAELDGKRLKEALKQEDKRAKNEELDERKRKYNSMSTVDVTEEEMEAYMLKKGRADDPMARMQGSGGYDLV